MMIWIKGDLIVLNLSVDECLRKLYVGIFERSEERRVGKECA